jgi:tetratricopeptide (TPR) repeat protein
MSNDNFNILGSLVEELKAKRVIPFIGAGVSRAIEKREKVSAESFNPLFSSWKEFLVFAAKKLRRERNFTAAKDIINLLRLSQPKYLEAAQIAYDSLDVPLWNKLLKESFEVDEDKAQSESLELAQLVWQLGSNLIFTTNIDEVLEWKAVKDEKIIVLDTQTDEFPELQREETIKPTLFYLHGRIRDKANIVFTLKQYEDFYDRKKNTAKLETLRSFLARKTFLFIGFSLDDPYFVKQLEYIHQTYNGAASFFYVLVRKEEKGKLKHLSYVKEVEYENFGEPLLKVMREMRDIAREANNGDIIPLKPEIPKPDKNKPFFNVQYNSKGKEFVGRKGKIDEIWNLLSQDGCASIGQAVSVKGFGGLGKTQLAVEYAHAYRDKYATGVFWIVADESIDNQLLQIADKQGWVNQYDKTVNQLDVAKAKFLQLSDCLILFDNVESYADIKDYLPKLNQQTHALITSREKIAEFRPINLDLLERNESRELLLKISNRNPQDEIEKKHLEKILEILGDIPLAIELVGGYLAEHETVTFAKYHQYLDEVPLDELEKEFPEGSFTGHDRSIIQTLRISEKTIKEKPFMVEILKVLAWSGSSSMGISILKALVESNNDFEFDNALGDAHKLRLLKKDEKDERYDIHRLLAKVIRHEQPLEEQNEWLQNIYNRLKSWFDNRKEEFNYLVEFEAEMEHLIEWQYHSTKHLPEQSIWLTVLESYPSWQRGDYKKSLQLLEKSFNQYKSEKVSNNELFAEIQSDLGVIYGKLGRHQEALNYQERALELQEELFGEEHPATATSYNNIGSAYGDLGKHQDALIYKEKALELRKKLLGEKHYNTIASYNNVGLTYGVLGNNQEALKFQEKALKLQKEVFGEEHSATAVFYDNIGLNYGALGNNQEALKFQKKALELQIKFFGEKHPSTAISYNNIGFTYGSLGKHQEALKFQEKALELQKEVFGEKHPLTATSYNNVGGTYGALGRHLKALQYKERAL